MLNKLDQAVCDFAQESYCYLLDRFGVRVGDIVCALTLLQTLTASSLGGYLAAFVCIGLGCFIASLQRNGRYEHINRAADLMRSLVILRVALVGFAVFNVAAGRHAFWDESVNVVLVYLLTCKVRDRDEGRIRDRKRRLAPQAG
ncbi:MAG TPA: hypothetical protein VIL72_11340 [Beijerinckiaceae bacterium]